MLLNFPPPAATLFIKTPSFGGICYKVLQMENRIRTLSPQESRIVLALTERGRQEATRSEIMQLLGSSAKATDVSFRQACVTTCESDC
jgi:hypothetical protein